MSYTVTTVASIVRRINADLYIPGIQRPYVWTTQQIIQLFDSLMRQYPIGTLLLWDMPVASRDDWEIYRFINNFWEGDIHNDRLHVPTDSPCTLVLDGQQRLTSLLIGLLGSYTVRQKHKRKNNAAAWGEKKLYIDLAHAPEGDDEVDDEDSPLAEHYRFAFFDATNRPVPGPGRLWFEVARIIDVQSSDALQILAAQLISAAPALPDRQQQIARANLTRLWDMVWTDKTIAYYTENSSSYDRVLDIFIRANDGGTKLSRSDLLMSVITLRWERFNAREETEGLIDDLTKLLLPKRAIQREFLLRTALFLNNLDFTIQVKNFTPANIRLLEQSWVEVKASLIYTASWLRNVGFYGDSLSGLNIAMLLSYYFHHMGVARGGPSLPKEVAEQLRAWVITFQFQRLLSLQVKRTFQDFRSIIRRLDTDAIEFPSSELALMFAKNGRHFGFNEEWVERYCDVSLQSVEAEKLLSVLYGGDLAVNQRRMVPFVKPESLLPEELRRAGIPDRQHEGVIQRANTLGVAVALSDAECNDYYRLPHEQWVQTLTPAQIDRHYLPDNVWQLRLIDLPELAKERRRLVGDHLLAHLPTAGKVGSGATL